MKNQYSRSSNYRTAFMDTYPPKDGHYRCVYCGKNIKFEEMEVDHVIAINRAKRNWLYRLCLHDGVNSVSNLVPSCHRCNRKKGSKGGLWAIRGHFWRFCLPIYVAVKISLGVALVAIVCFGVMVILNPRSIGAILGDNNLGTMAAQWLRSIIY